MTWAPAFEGTALTPANGVEIQKIRDDAKPKVQMSDVLAGGSVPKSVKLPGRRIRIEMNVVGTDAANAKARISALLDLFRSGVKGTLVLDTALEIEAIGVAGPIELRQNTPGGKWVKGFDVDFYAEGQHWQATSDTTGTAENTVTTPTFVTSHAGEADAWPLWEIANTTGGTVTGMTCIIRNATSSKEFRLYKFDLEDGDTLFIGKDGQPYLNAAAGANSKVPQRIDGAPFGIPGNSVNQTIEFEHNQGTGGGIDFTVRYRAAYQHFGEMP